MAKCDADIARVDAKLGNADFLKRAPEEVVEGEREKRDEAQARKAKLAEALIACKAPREAPAALPPGNPLTVSRLLGLARRWSGSRWPRTR